MEIGIIGLGNMGGNIAKRLIEKGHNLGVYDIKIEAADRFKRLGAKIFESPKALGSEYKYVITVLPDSKSVKNVVLGDEGVFHSMSPGSILIDMTTSESKTTKELGDTLQQKHILMVDAPVSGGVQKALQGTLTIMAGGDAQTLGAIYPILSDIGKNILHVGPLGAGHTVKVLNNLISAATMIITSEALAVGIKMGVDSKKMLEAINSSSGRNNSSETKFPQYVLTRKFDFGFTMELMCKDLDIAMNMARQSAVPMFVASTVFELWQYALVAGDRQLDHTTIVKTIEDMAKVEIK